MARGMRSRSANVRSRSLQRVLDVLLAMAAGLAVASIVMMRGGFAPGSLPLSFDQLALLEQLIVAYFICDRVLRIVLARDRIEHLRQNWADLVLIVLLAVALLITSRTGRNVVEAGAITLVIIQGYLLAVVIVRVVDANIELAESGLPPSWLLIASFAGVCLIGSGLLMLPAAIEEPYYAAWHYPDALFTAISATCVTGLVVVDTGTHFTWFGQFLILLMIQLGGLGIMTFGTMMALLAGRGLSVRSSETLGEMMAAEKVGHIGRVIRFVAFFTLLCEAIGAALLLPMFRDPSVYDGLGRALTLPGAIWHAVFHSVSAFCNAGFSLYAGSLRQGVYAGWSEPLRGHWQVLGVIAPLIVLGGLGFPVLQDTWQYTAAQLRRLGRRMRPRPGRVPLARPRLSLHSKIILTTSALLIVLGAVGLVVLETSWTTGPSVGGQRDQLRVVNPEWQELSCGQRAGEAVFQSVTARTAGFNTLDMSQLSEGGKLWMCGLMFIGGSPASTAGGLKTATFAVLLLAAFSVLMQRSETEAFHRSLSSLLLRRAVTFAVLYGLLVFAVALGLTIVLRGERLIDILFEACSACGTVGLSAGLTGRLGLAGKFIVMVGMFIGRIGPLTLLMALTAQVRKVQYTYPSEPIQLS